MLSIKPTQTYTTTDGKQFATRKEAESHQKFLIRAQRIKDALEKNGYSLESSVTLSEAASFVALHGDAFVDALTVKQNRGPRKATA